ncbi:hypothetical protein [Streptomyces candidus]|uniref:Uncharacterized protein n=1 Tax=Streptomyces candidus TaxID=67283 RepID=A0A7X0LS78_9ACTN|nr:hypothetical protein [Streptomyces candidus]MBB6439423.1 hypothetical protein [Streptomyces candidus]GHH54796.1 hypothetical protein GCM10018773_58340 [Streptomyces candidus]
MTEDEIARGVARGLQAHERRRAEGQARSLLAGLAILMAATVAFIVLVTYG